MDTRYRAALKLCVLLVSAGILTSCNMLTRLSEIKNGPQVSEISNPVSRPKYRPVSMPMPMPKLKVSLFLLRVRVRLRVARCGGVLQAQLKHAYSQLIPPCGGSEAPDLACTWAPPAGKEALASE